MPETRSARSGNVNIAYQVFGEDDTPPVSECEIHEGKVGGIAVHIGARVSAEAGPNEVLVSSTVRDFVAGSGIAFADRVTAELKGVPGEWKLYAVER
jgi:class 3 adenylate cyclase